MSFLAFLKKVTKKVISCVSPAKKGQRLDRFKPVLEMLEDRVLLANYYWNPDVTDPRASVNSG